MRRNFRRQSGQAMRVPQGGARAAAGKFKCCCGPGCKPHCDGWISNDLIIGQAGCDCCKALVAPDDTKGFVGRRRR